MANKKQYSDRLSSTATPRHGVGDEAGRQGEVTGESLATPTPPGGGGGGGAAGITHLVRGIDTNACLLRF